MSYDEWITLETVQGDLEAELIRGMLEAQEIPVLLSREGAGRAFGLTVGPMGEVEVLVPKALENDAKKILEQYKNGYFDPNENEED